MQSEAFTIVCVVLGLLAGQWGCASKPKEQSSTASKPVAMDRPIIDFARGGAGMPIDGNEPLTSAQLLSDGLLRAILSRVMFDGSGPVVAAEGGQFPDLELLRVDVSNGTVKPTYAPKQFKTASSVEPGISARRFEYLADPLSYQGSSTRWRVAADEARLGLLRDPKTGQRTLVITDASRGEMTFSVSLDDLRNMLLAGAKTHAQGGFSLRDVHFSVAAQKRSIRGDAKVEAFWLFIPTTFRVSGRADIDEQFNVRFSELSCSGEDVGGVLVSGFINAAMKKYDGKIMPLAVWPGNRIVITDVDLRSDEGLHMHAEFAGRGH